MSAEKVEQIPLAGDFDPPSREVWEAEVLKVLNRGRPPGKEIGLDKALARLRTVTVDDLSIEPIYTLPEGGTPPLGHPGVMPFERGTSVRKGEPVAWDICALYEDPDPKATNAAILTDLERGVTSLWLRLDDDALAPSDLPKALAGVIADLAGVRVSSRRGQDAAARALLDYWKSAGKDPATERGNLGLDPYAAAVFAGAKPDASGLGEWVRALGEFKIARAITVDVTGYHDAGAADVDELAFAIATGIDYLRALEADGVPVETGYAQILFRVSATADQFLTIARLRALRRLWARVGEELGVPAQQRGALQHAVSSARMATRDDPWVNMLRGTVAGFAASVGGADIVTVLPFDSAIGLPDDFSRRVARNTQVILAEESNIARVNDPAGGSWYVESLTDQLAVAAWALLGEIETAGGMGAAIESGLVNDRIDRSVQRRDQRLASRKQPITGVSMFPMRDETPHPATPRPDAPASALAPRRDAAVFEALRDRSRAAAQAGQAPAVFLAGIGKRRDFGARLTFVENLLLVAGIALPTCESGDAAKHAKAFADSGASVAILCSSPKVYAEKAIEVAKALKDAGAAKVLLAGQLREVGDADITGLIDGNVFDGMDVVGFLNTTLDEMEVAR